MDFKKFLVPILACFAGLLFSSTAKANIITIDYQNASITYKDKNAGIELKYKAVLVRDNKKYVYGESTKFDIDLMLLNPAWKSPTGRIYSSSHPNNPMGAGIIRFASKNEGYSENCSIHGGSVPEDKGQYLSGCCVRLTDEEFMQLFWNVTFETEVNILF